MFDIETVHDRILSLADTYENTEVADYQGSLNIRVGRRVVAVFNYLEGTLRVNEVRTGEQRSRVNDVLAILEADRRVTVIKSTPAPGIEAETTVWVTAAGASPFIPRTEFTLAALESPAAEFYVTLETVAGEIVRTPQPARTRVVDNLREV